MGLPGPELSSSCSISDQVQRVWAIGFATLALIDIVFVSPDVHADWDRSVFYVGENFEPLVAAPKEPRFFGSVQRLDGGEPLNNFNAGLIGLGEHFGLVRWDDPRADKTWELGVSSGLFALFQLREKATDLVSSDFLIAADLSYRNRNTSYRTRLSHQSAHLGDDFLDKRGIERINFSFEDLGLTATHSFGPWRAYGGGAYIVRAKPSSIERESLHIGGEYRGSARLWLGSRLLGGLHAEFTQQHDWKPNVRALVGIEFQGGGNRRFGIQLEAYDGYSPWGQFHDVKVRTVGSTVYVGF